MRGTQVFEAILGRHRRIAALILALAMLVSVPIGAFLALDGHDTKAPGSADGGRAGSASMPEAPPANLDLVRQSLKYSAQAQGVDYEPLELPEPAASRPLHDAVDEWLETRFDEVPEATRSDAHEQVREVPVELREPLARLLLAHAEATELQRQALQGLSDQERQRILEFAGDEAALSSTLANPPAWLADAAEKVDLARSFQATHLLVDAADATLPELRKHESSLARTPLAADDGRNAEDSSTPGILKAAHEAPASELADLDDLLETMAGPRPSMQPPAAQPLSEQLSARSAASRPQPIRELPDSLDQALGQLWLASTASADLLAAQGPDALLEAHLLRVRTMQETRPTLDAWGTALETSSADERHLSRPSLAAGDALDRAASLPASDPGTVRLLSFGLSQPQPTTSSSSRSQASGPIDGMEALYAATDADPPANWRGQASLTFSSLENEQREGLGILLVGLADAHRQANDALSQLSPDQRRFLLDHHDEMEAFLAGEQLRGEERASAIRALELVQLVDREQLAQAALTAADAIERARPLLVPAQAHGTDPGSQVPEDCPNQAPLSRCDQGVLFADPAGLVVVGTASDSTHRQPTGNAPVLLLDLGGNDTYEAPVADAHLLRPLSVGLDLGGADSFATSATGQGRGLGGVGLLVQAGGDTTYSTAQRGQGYGGLGGGIGALIDEGGDDVYKAQALAQAAVQPLDHGAGVLVDVEGEDRYTSSRGIGYSLGSTFLDLNGRDVYEPEAPAHGVRLDQGVDLDDVPDRVFEDRRDNALWLDGTFTLDAGFGLDVDGDQLDHDDDLFPSLVELLANSDANSGAQTPVTQAEDVAETSEDTDGDGSPDAAEEAAGTDPDDGNETPARLPGQTPMTPEQARELYNQLREEHSDQSHSNGLLLDVRMPLQDRVGYECPRDELIVCANLDGPGDGSTDADAKVGGTKITRVGPADFGAGTSNDNTAETETEAELGLVALGAPTNSTFELPYLLSVDLGGDDTYERGAGGAIQVHTSQETEGTGYGAPQAGTVSDPVDKAREERSTIPTLHLDLAGSDDYGGQALAQGAGGGLLADLGHGDDNYTGGPSTQGARGGLLFDEAGDDTYEAGADSQGAALPSFGVAAWNPGTDETAASSIQQAYELAHAAADGPKVRPSLVVDGAGSDRWLADEASQGFAGMTPGNASLDGKEFPATSRTEVSANETVLVGGLVDVRGQDRYEAGVRSQATTGPNGLAFLADRRGDDDYRARGLVSQAGIDTRAISQGSTTETRLPGLALLLDAGGADTYEVSPPETDNRSRTEEREGNITRERIPVGHGESEVSEGGLRLAAMQGIHADLEASDRDRDGDGWSDLVEMVVGTSESDDEGRPAHTAVERSRLIDLPTAGLVVGGTSADTYERDRVLAIDLGGSNTYQNNAGGPILQPLAKDPNPDVPLGDTDVEDPGEAHTSVNDAQLFEQPVAAVFDVGSGGSTFQAPGDLSQASSLFTVGLVVTAGGDNTFQAPGESRDVATVPDGPRASLDGLLGVKEYPLHETAHWLPEVDPARERAGQFGLVHDGRTLFLAGSIPDAQPGDDDELPHLDVHLATFNETPTLIDRLRLTPEDGGRLVDDHRQVDSGEWTHDELQDETPTDVRMDYAKGEWTFEIARPMDQPVPLEFTVSGLDEARSLELDLCQPTRVVDAGPFETVKVRDGGRQLNLTDPVEDDGDEDDDLHALEGADTAKIKLRTEEGGLAYEEWQWRHGSQTGGGESVDEGCRLFETEDVQLSPGDTVFAFLSFHDPTTQETWRYPPQATVEDGHGPFPADGDLSAELGTWIPVFPETAEASPPQLSTGPRVTQGASVAGVSLLASVSTGVGNDTYEAYRQAQGYATARGTGLVVDLGGPDSYDVQREGQGHATQDGHGLLVDHHGNDRYSANAKAQGHSPQPTTEVVPASNFANYQILEGVQARGSLIDLGGYDHYSYDDPEGKQALVPLPVPPSSSYETQSGNDRVWNQSEGGLGLDTALASHGPRSLLGSSTFAGVEAEAWPTKDNGECPSRRPPAGERLEWHANHSVRLAREEICLAVTVDDLIVDNVPLRRVEILLDGRREIVHDVRESSPMVDEWPLSGDRTRLVFPINTSDVPDGVATWRAIAFYDAPRPEGTAEEATWGPVPPVIAEDETTVAVSNPPSVESFQADTKVVSPTAAIGEPGFSFDAKVSPDLSAANHELAGYGKTREQIPCPFDEDRSCDRYTLYLKDGRMVPHRPDGTVPTTTSSDPYKRNSSTTYTHELREDMLLPGGETFGVAELDDSDLWTDLEPADLALVTDPTDGAVYADRDDDGQVSVGDVRLVPAGGRGPGTLVEPGDIGLGNATDALSDAVVAVNASREAFAPGDPLYLDTDNSSTLDVGDVRLLAHESGQPNGSLVSTATSTSLAPAEGVLQPENWTVTDTDRTADTIVVDRDGSSSISPGDVRLGPTHVAPNGSIELAYYHQPLYDDEVNVHASLATATNAGAARLVHNQTFPVFAEAHGRADVSPAETSALEPAGDDVEGWSHFWLPADDTRLYPRSPSTAGASNRLELDIRTAFDDSGYQGSLESGLAQTAEEEPGADASDIQPAIEDLADEARNWTQDTANWTQEAENWTRDVENWTEDPDDWINDTGNWTDDAQNVTHDAENLTRDIRAWRADVDAWLQDVQNWTMRMQAWAQQVPGWPEQDPASWQQDVANWSDDARAWQADTANWSDDVDRWSQDVEQGNPQDHAENLSAWSQDAENWTRDLQRWTEDAENWSRQLEGWTQDVRNWSRNASAPDSDPATGSATELADRPICATTSGTSSTARGPCAGLVMEGARATPSRVHLYIPSRTEQKLLLNATSVETGERFTFDAQGLGGSERSYRWPAEDAYEGSYNVSLTAYDQPANLTPEDKDEEETRRWADPVQGPTIRVDRQAPQTDIALPDYVGTSLIDSFQRTFQVPWTVSDPGEVEELRIFASTDGDEWELVERVHDADRGGVDYEFDADQDTFSFVAVGMDEAGNIEGLEENFWPTHWPEGGRCPTPLPDDVTVWPGEADAKTPDLNEHCFQNREAALDGAFRVALQENAVHTVTIDRGTPFIEDSELDLSSREGPREVRVDERPVLGLAGGEQAVPRACASDEGPAPIAEVNFFLLRSTPDGDKIERVHTLNQTDEPVLDVSSDATCYAFENLDAWTQDAQRYPEGFWTAGFEVVDGAGNSAETFLGTVYIDQQGPSLSEEGGIHLPEGQRAVMPGQTITVSGQVEDATGISEAHVAAPAFNTSGTVEVEVDDGKLAGELTIDREVPAGTYDVYLNVTDTLGNELVRHRSVPVNTTPTEIVDGPELTQLAPASDEGPPISEVPGGVGLVFETSTPSRFRVLAGAGGASPSQVYLYEGNFTTQHNVTIDSLSPGQTYTVEVVAFSEGGHKARSAPLEVQAGPAFATEVVEPAEGGLLGPDSRIAWQTTAAPNASLGEKASSLISMRRSPNATFRPVGGHTHGFNDTHLDVDLDGLASGNEYALRIETAVAGQRDVTLVEPITVDTAAPTVSLAEPEAGWTRQARPTIQLQVSDALAGVPQDPVVSARLDGEPVATGTLANDSRLPVRPGASLEEGVHRLEVEIEDRLGNTAQETMILTVDRQAPTLRFMDTPQAPVAPGADVPIEVFTSDDGRIANVEARLGSQTITAQDPGGLDELDVPVPVHAGPAETLVVRAEDAAGNQRTENLTIAVDDAPPKIRSLEATAGVASAEINLSADEPVRLVASAGGTLAVSPPSEAHELTVDGLQPDAQQPIQLRVSDRAGHTLHRTLSVHTEPDRSPPGEPGDVRVQPRADGTIALAWDQAEDEAGIAFYRLARTTPGSPTWQSLDRTSDTQFVDEDVEASKTYRYRVQAVDLVSKTGSSATSEDVSPLAKPQLVDPEVKRVGEDDSRRYAFEVTYRHPADQAPEEVRLILDGSLVEMEAVPGEAEEGTRYRATLDVDPHTPSGSHTYRFEAHTDEPPLTVQVPEHGNFTGPLVSTLDDEGVPSLNPAPLPAGLAALALLATALAARVRRT